MKYEVRVADFAGGLIRSFIFNSQLSAEEFVSFFYKAFPKKDQTLDSPRLVDDYNGRNPINTVPDSYPTDAYDWVHIQQERQRR